MAVMSCALVRLRRNKQVRVSNFCDEKARARFGGLPLSCGDVPLSVPDPQDKRWREQSFARQADFSISLRNSQDNGDAPDGLWISRIRVLEHGVCREFALVFAKHTQSRSRSSTRLRSGWIGCSVTLGRCKRKGERGSMREQGLDGRHR